MRRAGLKWALKKSRIGLEAQIAKMEASKAALNVDIAQPLAVKEEELQEELAAFLEQRRELNQTHYHAQNTRLRNLMGSKRCL